MGPVYSFWCFSFERYNGILESFQKNWHAPEIQVLQKFVLMQTLNATKILPPTELSLCLNALKKNYTMLEDTRRIFDSMQLYTYEKNIVSLPIHYTKNFFHESTRNFLHKMYTVMYGNKVNSVPLRYEEFTQLEVFGSIYTSQKSRHRRSDSIMAVWRCLNGSIINRSFSCEDVRTGVVEYFISHTPRILGLPDKPHILAKVQWYQDHPRKNWFKNSLILSATLFDEESEASFIPVSRIMSRCAVLKKSLTFDYGQDNVNVCIPLVRRVD